MGKAFELAIAALFAASLAGCAGTATTPTVPIENHYSIEIFITDSRRAAVTITGQDKATSVTASNAANADNAPEVDATIPLELLP